MAIDNGHFEAEGLEVEVAAGQGSLDAIPKVATGAYPLGFADMASLIKFLDQNPDAPVTGVMMFYDKPAFAVVGRISRGVEGPGDLEGKILGAPPPDGAWAQFPAFRQRQRHQRRTTSPSNPWASPRVSRCWPKTRWMR
jgi:NitT/TauT family transport system substrate-binding protein